MKITITNERSPDLVSAAFCPIIPEALKAYRDSLSGADIVNIRLMGSVPRGDAREIHSDIDFVCICRTAPEKKALDALQLGADALTKRYKFVRKVDLEFELQGKIPASREFIFRTDSISVFGDDPYPPEELVIDSLELAEKITPGLERLITRYRDGVQNARSGDELILFSRWIGKDILKSLRYRLIVEQGIYERSPVKIHAQLVRHYPEDRELFDALLNAYLAPGADAEALEALLSEAGELI